MKNKKILLSAMYVTIFLASFGFIMYSALVSAFSETYSIPLAQAGIVGSVLCVGQLVMIFFNDMLARRMPRFTLITVGVLAHLVSMFWIAASISFAGLLAAFFVNGAAISLLNVVMSAYISDLSGDKRNSYLNIFHGVYGLGSLAGPILPTFILACGLNWKLSYFMIGGISFLLLAGLLLLGRKQKKTEPSQGEAEVKAEGARPEPGQEEPFFKLLKNPHLLMTCFAALLFMGFDMTISTYMSSYLELALDASAIAGLTITFYWTGSAAGRLVYPVLFAKYDTKKYLICVNLVTAVLLVLGLAVTKPAMMIVLIFLVGLLSGVNFPLEIGLACEQFPKSSVGATNAVSIFGSLGGIIFPMLAGGLMDAFGYASLLLLGGVMMLVIAGCLTGMAAMNKNKCYK